MKVSVSPELLISHSEHVLQLQNLPRLMFWEVLQHELKLLYIVYFSMQSIEHLAGRDPVLILWIFFSLVFVQIMSCPFKINQVDVLTGIATWLVIDVYSVFYMDLIGVLQGNFFPYFFCTGECHSLPKYGSATQNVSPP